MPRASWTDRDLRRIFTAGSGCFLGVFEEFRGKEVFLRNSLLVVFFLACDRFIPMGPKFTNILDGSSENIQRGHSNR